MSSYTSSPIFAISGAGIKNNSGTIMGASPVSSLWNNLSLNTNSTIPGSRFTYLYPSWNNGVSVLLQNSGVALTSAITQSSATGRCLLNIASHGFSVGQIVIVLGTDVSFYNQIHRVTNVIDTNNVQTDVPYSVNATVAGTFKTPLGNIATMVAHQYVGPIIGNYVAGLANTVIRSPGAEFFRVPYNVARGQTRLNITSWDYVTGKATFGGSAGTQVNFHDIAGNNDSLLFEPFPTKAVPGHLVYFYSDLDQANVAYYKARQE